MRSSLPRVARSRVADKTIEEAASINSSLSHSSQVSTGSRASARAQGARIRRSTTIDITHLTRHKMEVQKERWSTRPNNNRGRIEGARVTLKRVKS